MRDYQAMMGGDTHRSMNDSESQASQMKIPKIVATKADEATPTKVKHGIGTNSAYHALELDLLGTWGRLWTQRTGQPKRSDQHLLIVA